jgi:DNA replication ATP-dependent helicase Dna2
VLIACIGWGSLIWRPGSLPVRGRWFGDGPVLPLEFARQSGEGHLSLVIVPGETVTATRTLWNILAVDDVDAARSALGERERIPRQNWNRHIGVWQSGRATSTPAETTVARWAERLRLDGAVWTALPVKFGGQERFPSAEEVLNYLRSLQGDVRTRAEEYVRNAPSQINTPYRELIAAELGWFPQVIEPPILADAPLQPQLNVRRSEVVAAIRSERKVATIPFRFAAGTACHAGTLAKIAVEPLDDKRPVDEILEGQTAEWAVGRGEVLCAVPGESSLYLRFVSGQLPDPGMELRIRPPDYLEKLQIEWCRNSNARKAFAWLDAQLPPVGQTAAIDVGHFPWLRKGQRAAFRLTGQRLGFLWGPPGTGKTTTVGCIVAEYALQHPNHRVLLVCSTNAAVDLSIIAVDRALERVDGAGVSIRAVRDGCRRIGTHFVAEHFVGREHLIPDVPEELVRKLSEMEASRPNPADALAYGRWKSLCDEVRDSIRELLRADLFAARVAAMTATRAVHTLSELDLLNYDLVVFDEASQIGLAQAAILAPLASRSLFAGDPKQLAPIVQAEESEEARCWLGRSAFVLMDRHPEWTCLLDEQNRMAEPICRVVSDVFYQGRLSVAHDAVVDTGWREHRTPIGTSLLGTANVCLRRLEQEGVHGDTGWYRPLSCDFICNSIQELLQHQPPASILVVTPFRLQRNRIRHALRDRGVTRVDITTVHRAQGSERHTVFFDPVRGDRLGVFGDYGERLINVALSRAQARLVIPVSNGDLENPILHLVSHVAALQESEAAAGGSSEAAAPAGPALLAKLVWEDNFPHGYERALTLYQGHLARILPMESSGNFKLAFVDGAGVKVQQLNSAWCREHPDLL